MTQDNRNMIVAVLLSAIVLLGWTFASEKYFPQPKPAPAIVAAAAPASTSATAPVATDPASPGSGVPGTVPAAPAASAPAASAPADRAVVLAATPRVAIATPRLQGSINLKGARFDDLVMVDYRMTIDPASPPVRLLSPSNTTQKDSYFSQFGWAGAGAPPLDADWTASAPTLTPAAPVTLTWVAPNGVRYEQIIAVDRDFMFTVRQRVTNPGAASLTLRPWGLVSRFGKGGEEDSWTLHIGALGVLGGTLKDAGLGLEELASEGPQRLTSTGGWLGMTGKYWLTALVADNKTPIEANFAAAPDNRFQADFLAAAVTIPAGASTETTARFFAGAKEVALLDRYTETLGIPRLDLAVSWGWFEIIAKPIYMLLHWLFEQTGNFGLAIIGLTILVRLALFPIANKQYESMAKMRIVAPRMKAIQERHKDDKLKAQQEMMALYKTEKVNPLAGCLPLILQIPIFYALYKTLLVSTEMRHQPFALWIKDLSAPDPLTPLNLFGAIPWTPPAMIAIGIFPIILGVTMYLQQRMNPTPMDPVQKQVFAIMPWMFMFIMAPFAAGLQLYWIVNNIISIGQQWWMLKKYPMPATPPEPIDLKPTAKPVLVKPAAPRK